MKNLLYSFVLVFALFLVGCADAGKDQIVNSGTTVTLDANASTASVGGEIKKYAWRQVKGLDVNLSDSHNPQATFTAPIVNEDTTLLFRLTTIEYGGMPRRFVSRDFVRIKILADTNATDTEAPVLTLIGDQNITLTVGSSFVDEGTQAIDNADGDITDRVITEGTVDTNTTGVYTLTYSVTDTAGNEAVEITRIITVVPNMPTTYTISGTILDTNGTVISGALVTIGTKTVTSDSNGTYSIDGVTANERIKIDVTHPDYLANSRITGIEDEDVSINVKLGSPKVTLTFSALDGATASHDGASVILPPAGYMDANGTAYTGDVIVKMSYYPITTQSGRAAFPGTFEGIEGNNTFPIQSYGFMNVELTDPQGNALNLDANSTATLIFPKDSNLNSPFVIPLWYYDKDQGYWVEEGQAVSSVNHSVFEGTVTHFTSWNLDAKGPVAKLQGCVEDESGTKVTHAVVQFVSENWYSHVVPTDENGSISVFNVLAQKNLTFSAWDKIGSDFYYGEYPTGINLSANEEKVLPQCIILKKQGSTTLGTVTVIGTLVGHHLEPKPNATVKLFANGQNIASGTTSSDSSFSITFQTVDTLIYRIGWTTFSLREHQTLYNLGTVQPLPR